MSSGTLLSKLLKDTAGASLVEAGLTLPVYVLAVCGTMEISLYLWNAQAAVKATQRGARTAIVSSPVASGLDDLSSVWATSTQIGQNCTNPDGSSTGFCAGAAINSVCTPTSLTTGACTGGRAFSGAAFQTIFTQMQAYYPALQPQNVQISYAATGLGFVGRPGGLPMTVIVSIRCLTNQFAVLGGLANILGPGACGNAGWPIPASTSVLTTESLGVAPTT